MSDTEQPLPRAAELPLLIAKAVNNIGKRNGTKLPPANEADVAAAQEYFIANEAYKAAESRRTEARAALIAAVTMPTAKGTHVVINSPHVVVTAMVKSNPSRLDKQALINAMAKRFDCSIEDATALVDACSSSSGTQAQFTVAIRDPE